ncbi:MAG: hypothetical protein AB1847_23695 [bacterium]
MLSYLIFMHAYRKHTNERVWDVASGKPVSEPLHHEGGIYSASFSPDGRWVVTASWDHTARIWDAASGKPINEPLWHENDVQTARFSPDGRWVVTASSDHTACVWDAASGKPVSEPLRHEGAVYSARFSPDGQWVVTASWDHTARIWEICSLQSPPVWVADLAEAYGGWRINESGGLVLKTKKDELLKEIRAKVSQLAEKDNWAKKALWFFQDRSTRTISPRAAMTIPEYVSHRLEENTIASLNEALDISPGNPLALARLGRLKLDQNESENSCGKSQADVLTALAVKLAPDNAEVWHLRGQVLQGIGRPGALKAYMKAHELNHAFDIPANVK